MNKLIESIRKYKYIGIRGCTFDENYEIGDACRSSYDWDYENDISSYDTENPVKLNGTCAANLEVDSDDDTDEEIIKKINNLKENFNYAGKKIIIASNDMEYGADCGEIILEDAIVLAYID